MAISKSREITIWLIVLLLGLGAIILGPRFVRARSTKAACVCINNLRAIDTAKWNWQIEYRKSVKDRPSWDDLPPYFHNGEKPVCPEGGNYVLGRVDELPRCSRGGPEHTLPN